MRKLNYLFVALMTMLLVASCSQDETLSIDTNSNEAMVSFNLELPDSGPQTRADIGDGRTVNQLVYAVYHGEGEEVVTGLAGAVVAPTKEASEGQFVKDNAFDDKIKKETVNFSLLKGKEYTVVFWAQKKGTEYYDTKDLKAVEVNYKGDNNDESRDAFFGKHTFTVSNDASIDVVLNRPFAQLNVGVTTGEKGDYENAKAAGFEVAKSSVVINKVADKINLLTGEATGGVSVTYNLADIPTDPATLTAAGKDYKYLSMSYILVGEEKTTLDDLTYVFSDGNGETVTLTQGLTSVPVQRNYRTNIVGKLLTGDIEFNITIDEIFKTPDYNVTETVTTVAELTDALGNSLVTNILVLGEIGSEDAYTVYNVNRPVTIQGISTRAAAGAKVFGTFIVKSDDVTIEGLAIQNQGDLTGETPTAQSRGNIIVFAKNVIIKNNTITHGMGDQDGLANAIQIFSSVADNPLSNYVVEGNTVTGFKNTAKGSSSSAILIAEGYKSSVLGKAYTEIIIATPADYEYLENGNTFSDNAINVTHQNWADGRNVLYPKE